MPLQKSIYKNGLPKDIKVCGNPDKDLFYLYNEIANTKRDFEFLKNNLILRDKYVLDYKPIHEIYHLENHGELVFILKNGDLFITDDSTPEFSDDCPSKYMEDDYEGDCPEKYSTYSFTQISQNKKEVHNGTLEYIAFALLQECNGEDMAVFIYCPSENGWVDIKNKKETKSEYVEDLNWLLK